MTRENGAAKGMAMSVLMESIIRSAYTQRSPGDLLPLQWSILRYLHGCNAQHASISYLARFLGLTHAPISRSVSTLKKRDLVKSVQTPAAARGFALSLTQKGKIVLQDDPLKRVASAIGFLPEEQISCMAQGIEHLILELNATREIPK